MPGIKAKEFEPIEALLRRFKKQSEKAGTLREIRRREAYEKPSVRRKKKSIAARLRAAKQLSRRYE